MPRRRGDHPEGVVQPCGRALSGEEVGNTQQKSGEGGAEQKKNCWGLARLCPGEVHGCRDLEPVLKLRQIVERIWEKDAGLRSAGPREAMAWARGGGASWSG